MSSANSYPPQDLEDETDAFIRENESPSTKEQLPGSEDKPYTHHAASLSKLSLSAAASASSSTTYRAETWVLVGFTTPLFLNMLIQRWSTVLGPITAMGQYGPVQLAGAALANTTLNILLSAPTYGITSALDTLSTQAHGGALQLQEQQQREPNAASASFRANTRPRDLNLLYSMRVLLVLAGLMVLMLPLLVHSGPLFLLLAVEAEAAAVASRYMRLATLGLPGFVGYEVLRKYCQAQGKMLGPAVASFAAAPFSYFFLRSQMFGVDTPPLALALYFNAMFIAECIWAFYYLPEGTFTTHRPPFSVVMQDLKIVVKLGAAGTASSCSDWWAWEFLSFASAWLGDAELAANGVFLTSAHFFFALPGALMNSSSTRVGNYLGRNESHNAKIAAYTSLWMGVAVAGIGALAMHLNSARWTSIYTSDPEVTAVVEQAFGFFAFIVFLDAVQGVYGGILRGAGLPIEIARIMLVGHYALGLPLATLFAFSSLNWGLLGLWSGFGVGLVCVCLRLTWITVKNDWELGARKAQEHLKSGSGEHRVDVAMDGMQLP